MFLIQILTKKKYFEPSHLNFIEAFNITNVSKFPTVLRNKYENKYVENWILWATNMSNMIIWATPLYLTHFKPMQFSYSPRKSGVFWCFHGVKAGNIAMKWVQIWRTFFVNFTTTWNDFYFKNIFLKLSSVIVCHHNLIKGVDAQTYARISFLHRLTDSSKRQNPCFISPHRNKTLKNTIRETFYSFLLSKLQYFKSSR